MILKNHSNTQVDISALYTKFREKYKNVYIYQFENIVFIYRAIGRKEYTQLILQENLSEPEKEELLCRTCCLYPENFDFENCDEAGIPTSLTQEIVKNSYLSKENREKVLQYHRSEMYDLDNQINCIILAAFPNYSLEEIENWDVVTACKYYSRAEWILHNIKGVPLREKDPGSDYSYIKEHSITEEVDPEENILKSTAPKNNIAHNGKPKAKPKLTPEKLRELKAKYPEIDWENDDGLKGVEGLRNQPIFDKTPPALRPRNQMPKIKM